jgi:hypothetical protein
VVSWEFVLFGVLSFQRVTYAGGRQTGGVTEGPSIEELLEQRDREYQGFVKKTTEKLVELEEKLGAKEQVKSDYVPILGNLVRRMNALEMVTKERLKELEDKVRKQEEQLTEQVTQSASQGKQSVDPPGPAPIKPAKRPVGEVTSNGKEPQGRSYRPHKVWLISLFLFSSILIFIHVLASKAI